MYHIFRIIPHHICETVAMVYTNWYPGAPSMTASKYLKYSVAYTKPFEPGQRYRNRRDMEMTVKGKIITMLHLQKNNLKMILADTRLPRHPPRPTSRIRGDRLPGKFIAAIFLAK